MELLKLLNGTAPDRIAQRIATAFVGFGLTALVVVTLLSATGVWVWPDLNVITGTGEPVAIGKWLILGAMTLFLLVASLLPGSLRVLALERSHRDFRTSMEDVTRAYWIAHAADREGLFQMPREFDAVRERFEFLRDHPDLEELQPELLELAAQMGAESRTLANLYSDTKVKHAREMLEVRRHEAAEMQERIAKAMAVTREMKRLVEEVEMDEAMAQSALNRLREELDELMPKIETATPEPPEPKKRPRLRVAASDNGK